MPSYETAEPTYSAPSKTVVLSELPVTLREVRFFCSRCYRETDSYPSMKVQLRQGQSQTDLTPAVYVKEEWVSLPLLRRIPAGEQLTVVLSNAKQYNDEGTITIDEAQCLFRFEEGQ